MDSLNIDAILVFSTYVEVILWFVEVGAVGLCILHVCGGDPIFATLIAVFT